MKSSLPLLLTATIALAAPAFAERQFAPIPPNLLPAGTLKPRAEQGAFVVVSKQGLRVLVSRDDGRTWTQTFLGGEDKEDGGFHGQLAVYGVAYTNGVVGVFSGWGAPGLYVGSDDGERWAHLPKDAKNLGSVWGATAGKGVMLASSDPWRGATLSDESLTTWTKQPIGKLAKGAKTHHFLSGFGDHKDGTFVVVGDHGQVFFSPDLGRTWNHALIPTPEGLGKDGQGQNGIAFGNGVFLVDYPQQVARSTDGGATWTLHPHGLQGKAAWRGLSFVNGEFWLTARGGGKGRRSKDGVTWEDLPTAIPGGAFVQSDTGTIINVERGRSDIRRSTDAGQSWETVFTGPEKDPTWSLAFAVFGKLNAPKP